MVTLCAVMQVTSFSSNIPLSDGFRGHIDMFSDVSLVKARWGGRHSGFIGGERRLRDSGGRRSDGADPSPHGGRRDGPARRGRH